MKATWIWLALSLALCLSLGLNLGLVASRFLPEGDETEATSEPETTSEPADVPVAESPLAERPQPQAHEAAPRLPPPVMRRMARVARELGLDGAEREAFLDLQRDFFGRFVRSRHQTRRLQAELRRLLVSDRPDRARADALIERMLAAQSEAERAFLDHYFAVRDLLDDEQMRRYRHVLGELRRVASARGEAEPGDRPPRRRPQGPPPRPGDDP